MNITTLGYFTTILALPLILTLSACDTDTADTREAPTLRAIGVDLFELEGDAVDDANVDGVDWDKVLDPSDGGGSFENTGVMADQAGTTIFGGGNKDIQDVTAWSHTMGSVPDKNDITNAYAAAYNIGGELIIFFGADRFTTDGDAQLGFWFFQHRVTAELDGSFSGEHVVGDVLVLVNFQNGGTAAEIQALEWVGSGGDQQGGTLRLMATGGVCDDTEQTVCAITNSTAADSPWPYTPKGGSEGDDFPPQSFFEGGINITQVFSEIGETVPCFASFMAESRSSTSVTASLKDFVLDEFRVCSIEIMQECVDGQISEGGDGFTYEFAGTVTNDGFGTLYDVTVTAEGNTTIDLGILNPGGSADFGGTFDSAQNPATSTSSVAAATTPGGELTVTDTSGPAICPMVALSPEIDVMKSCELALAVDDGQVVLEVNYTGMVCNTSDSLTLVDVTVTDDVGTADTADDVPHGIGTLLPGACADYSGSYRPSSTNNTDPTFAYFEDAVTATGTPSLGGGEATDMATAHCELCPAGE